MKLDSVKGPSDLTGLHKKTRRREGMKNEAGRGIGLGTAPGALSDKLGWEKLQHGGEERKQGR